MSEPVIGWVGLGRMGLPMASRLVESGMTVKVWNRTRAKAEPLKARGAEVVDNLQDLADSHMVFTMVSTGAVVEQILFGKQGLLSGSGKPGVFVDCSTIGVDQSASVRDRLAARGIDMLAAPVSGNGKCVKAGKMSTVVSGPHGAFKAAEPVLASIAGGGVSYVGEGELARICKLAHNVFLSVTIHNLCEVALLVNKAGVSRAAFLDFINDSVMGSVFSRYKSNALVNLDWTTTFTPALLRKDMDLGLEAARNLGVSMPVTAATREVLQSHFGAATLRDDPNAYLERDFAAVLETLALAAGMQLESENTPVPSGLEVGSTEGSPE